MKTISNNLTEIYCDGSCIGSAGNGGWAYLIKQKDNPKYPKVNCGRSIQTTNSRMEMAAAIEALKALPSNSTATLFSDSELLVKGINTWLKNWIAKGWERADRKPVANKDLWQQIANLLNLHNITAIWVKAHSNNADNNFVDSLARAQAYGTFNIYNADLSRGA